MRRFGGLFWSTMTSYFLRISPDTNSVHQPWASTRSMRSVPASLSLQARSTSRSICWADTGLIFFGQQESRHAAVCFGDDPEGILPEALAGFFRVNWVGREIRDPAFTASALVFASSASIHPNHRACAAQDNGSCTPRSRG